MKNKRGITLIALIITIIVLLILAGVSMNAIIGDNGIITQAQRASVMTKFASYNEEMGMNIVNDTGIYASGNKLKKYIPSIEDNDVDKFVIIKSKLLYIGTDDFEAEMAQKAGLGSKSSSDSSDSASAIKEIQSIISGVIEVKDEFKEKIPASDSDLLNEDEHKNNKDGLIGTRLFDRVGLNLTNKTWNILVEYDTNNKETGRYGTGYYWLKKGETYIIDEESIEFKNDYVVNYAKNEYIILSGRAVNWNENATLAVTGAILNLDAMNLSDGEWINNTTNKSYETELAAATTPEAKNAIKENFYNFYVTDIATSQKKDTGIQRTGDVVYDATNRALAFNKSEGNITGEGGYLTLTKPGDFTKGFTFEIYANLDRLTYNNKCIDSILRSALFCKIDSINNSGKFTSSMRFGYNLTDGLICKFIDGNSLNGGNNLRVRGGGVISSNGPGYRINEDFYLTYIYRRYSEYTEQERNKMEWNQEYDKVEYYINGKLFGDTYYVIEDYNNGCKVWGKDTFPFFVGVCPWSAPNNLYYLQGNVYSCRLYNKSISEKDVKDNYNTTVKWRNSGL